MENLDAEYVFADTFPPRSTPTGHWAVPVKGHLCMSDTEDDLVTEAFMDWVVPQFPHTKQHRLMQACEMFQDKQLSLDQVVDMTMASLETLGFSVGVCMLLHPLILPYFELRKARKQKEKKEKGSTVELAQHVRSSPPQYIEEIDLTADTPTGFTQCVTPTRTGPTIVKLEVVEDDMEDNDPFDTIEEEEVGSACFDEEGEVDLEGVVEY
jgi:hypothetical protein